jgi:hypothetical protein
VGRRGRGVRYPDDLRDQATSYLARARARGESLQSVATELDLPAETLRRWTDGAKRPQDEAEAAFQEIRIVEETRPEAGGELVVTGPAGITVRGLDLDGVVVLMQKLA